MVQTLENWQFPQKLNTHLPRDPEITVSVIFTRGMKTHVHKKPLYVISLAALFMERQKLETVQVSIS